MRYVSAMVFAMFPGAVGQSEPEELRAMRQLLLARVWLADTARAPARSRLLLACLMVAHLAADIAIGLGTSASLGLREFGVVGPIAVGLVWGQAVLLGQVLLLWTGMPILRTSLVAAWLALTFSLGDPAFRALGFPSGVAGGCFFVGVPLFCSVIIAVTLRGRGCRIISPNSRARHADHDVLRFSLRQLFKLTSWAAVVLAITRITCQAFENSPWWLILFFGLPALINAFALQAWLSPWAVLSGQHAVCRSAALQSLAIASLLPLLLIGKADASTCWAIACPIVVQSCVVVGTLGLIRAIGYRSVTIAALAFFRSTIRPAHMPRPCG